MNFWEKLEKPIVGLSPMDGVTDASFRFITAKHGHPDVIFTEFVNVETAFFAPDTLLKDFTYSQIERPVVAQVYGHTPERFYKVAHIVCELGFDGLDINMGCPAKNVANRGSGAALIRNPELACSIIRAARQGVADWSHGQTLSDLQIDAHLIERTMVSQRLKAGATAKSERLRIPVSIKTRIGYDRVVVDDWIKMLLDESPAAISLHGRTLQQKYSGNADWDAIGRAAEIAKGSGTLVIGNGDIKDLEDAYRRVRDAKVDGALIGRSAQGNPWVFRSKDRVKQVWRANEPAGPVPFHVSLAERFRVMIEHSRHFENRAALRGFTPMRKHLAWYCKSSPKAAALRAQMVRLNSTWEVLDCLGRYGASIGWSWIEPEFDARAELPDIASRAATQPLA